jgi:hypothetical protein
LAGAHVLAESPSGPRIVHYRLNKGHVVYCIDPVEHYRGDASVPAEAFGETLGAAGRGEAAAGRPADAYELVLQLGGVERIAIDPPDPGVHAMMVDTQSGGRVYVLYNTAEESRKLTVRHGQNALQLTIAAGRPALAHFDERGALLGVECQDEAALDGEQLWQGAGHFMLVSLDEPPLGGDCKKLLVMAVGEGDAHIAAADGLASPHIEYGEFRDARWQPFKASGASVGTVRIGAHGTSRSGMAIVLDRQVAGEADEAMEALLAR